MGYLALAGAELVIGLVIGVLFAIVGLFFGHIILFDSIAIGIISGVCCHSLASVHPALCLLIGLAVFAGLVFLQSTRFGFWIIGVLLSAVWAFVFAFFAYAFTGEDMVWFYVVLGLAFLLMLWLHIKARDEM